MTRRSVLDNISRFLRHAPRWLGENPFIGFSILLCLALLISSLVFWRYVFVPRSEDVVVEITQFGLDQKKLQQVIQSWQEREEKFDQAGSVYIRNIFEPPQAIQELTE